MSSYKQLRGFDQSKAGKAAGYCLKNVREGFSIAAKYDYALDAWKNTQQHANRDIPTGVDVPLYYSYVTGGKNQGHINVHLANGTVWSDGNIYRDLPAYEAATAPVYLGWGESVNGVRVIEPEIVLASAPVQAPQSAPSGQVNIRITPGKWNVRTSPSVSAAVIGNGTEPALGGQPYSAYIQPNGWAQIQFTGRVGYVGPKVYTRI